MKKQIPHNDIWDFLDMGKWIYYNYERENIFNIHIQFFSVYFVLCIF